MKDSNGKNNNKKDDEIQRYKDIFNSFNDVSETDEVLHQLAELNFNEEKNVNLENNNLNIKSKANMNEPSENVLIDLNTKKIDNIQEQNNDNLIINSINKDEKPLSIILLKEKINRIYITMQGLNFKDKDLNNLTEFIPYIHNIEQNNYLYIDKILDTNLELLSRIKEEMNVKEKFIQKLNNVSLGIENYEKKNLINQKKLKDKENEVILLMNKLELEKEKSKDNSKSIILELNSLKKENQELTDTILIYKNKLRKKEADYQVIQEKLKNIPNDKENKNKISFISNNEDKNENGLNNSKINDKYFLIKKLNMSLTYLLKEINKMLIKYDSSLIKLLNNKNYSDKVIDLNCNIETNLLLDDANMKIFRKNFLYNMDRIFKKIEIIQKGNMDIREININSKNNNNISINEVKNVWKKNVINNKLNKSVNKSSENEEINSSDNKINISKDNNGKDESIDEKHFKNNISSKWYDKYNNKKIGYVFDKEKVITCEDDDNGAK